MTAVVIAAAVAVEVAVAIAAAAKAADWAWRPTSSQFQKPVWSGSNTQVMQGKNMYAQSESKHAVSSPGVMPVGPCRLGRACAVFYFLLVAVDRVTAASAYVFLQSLVSNHTLTTPSCRHYRLATVPVTLQVILPAL